MRNNEYISPKVWIVLAYYSRKRKKAKELSIKNREWSGVKQGREVVEDRKINRGHIMSPCRKAKSRRND